jgi:hypothetical protein
VHSDPKFGWRGGGVSYINDRKKRLWNGVPTCVLLRHNFQNGVPLHFVIKMHLDISNFPKDTVSVLAFKMFRAQSSFI